MKQFRAIAGDRDTDAAALDAENQEAAAEALPSGDSPDEATQTVDAD